MRSRPSFGSTSDEVSGRSVNGLELRGLKSVDKFQTPQRRSPPASIGINDPTPASARSVKYVEVSTGMFITRFNSALTSLANSPTPCFELKNRLSTRRFEGDGLCLPEISPHYLAMTQPPRVYMLGVALANGPLR